VTYQEALQRTAHAAQQAPVPGSEAEARATAAFTDFVRQMRAESIAAHARRVYAEDAYFNDTVKEIEGSEAIAEYLAESLGATEEVNVEVVDVVRSGMDFYYRWVMDIKFRSLNGGNWARSEGMSQVRFNGEGRVVLHRDFWDAAGGLFAYMPVVGWLIKWIKGRI
jgi:ketosteroid isomerase-like protein